MRTTHGDSKRAGKTSAYRSWRAMWNRCVNGKNHKYPHYGGRGIKVCERWRRYENFKEDMGARPEGTSLDRINNDGNYEPGNCRWATLRQQNRNTRVCKLTEEAVREIRAADGKRGTIKPFAEKYGVSLGLVHNIRSGIGWEDVQP